MTDKGYMRDKCVRISRAAISPAVWLTTSLPAFTCSKIKRSEFPNVEGYLSQAAIAPFKSPCARHSLTVLRSPFGASLPSLEVSKRCKAITKASNPSKYNGYIMNPPALICAAQSICTPCGCSSSLVVPSSYTSPSSSPSTGTGVAISLGSTFGAFFISSCVLARKISSNPASRLSGQIKEIPVNVILPKSFHKSLVITIQCPGSSPRLRPSIGFIKSLDLPAI